jgi:uncharacterized protein
LEHGFLAAMEASGTVGAKAGMVPRFVLSRSQGRLVGAMPFYRKTHSYGEFIFDWSWANASHRSGVAYYPKLVAAIPFTPATGSRIMLAADVVGSEREAVITELVAGARALADAEKASSLHVLFCMREESEILARMGFAARLSLQFHWHNRVDAPYRDFDDYLGAMKSRHRKQIRHERRVASEHGLTFQTVSGADISELEWRALQSFYSANADRHGSIEYLTPAFFELLRATYAHRVVCTIAYQGAQPVAGTFNLEKGRHLYGRYWGCLADHQMLHFELCYHRLIERAIARQYTRFEAGAQGEHKLKRGLTPSFTYSAHWIRHPGLASAVSSFLESEAVAVRQQAEAYQAESPFRTEASPEP